MDIIYFDLLPKDILYVIVDNIEKELTYPLLFIFDMISLIRILILMELSLGLQGRERVSL